jgi:glucan phosphoethanolaminetransferase (alkaline phosphatase superfamily)
MQRTGAAAIYVAIWVISFLSILSIGFMSSQTLRFFWGFLISISALVSSLHYQILHEPVGIDSFEMLIIERANLSNAISNYGNFAISSVLKAILLFIALTIPSPKYISMRYTGFIPSIPIIIIIGIIYHTAGSGLNGLPGQFTSLSTVLSVAFSQQDINAERKEVEIPIVNKDQVKHIVLIIDESIRADYIDLNKDQNVTPYLKEIRNDIINFGIATSGANCSSTSNAIIRMGGVPQNLGISSKSIMKNPTIWQFFHKAGYKTTYIDAQNQKGNLHNFMNQKEFESIDQVRYIDGENYEKDHLAAKIIQDLLLSEEPQFIYLNKAGAHFHYEDYYPDNSSPFVPHMVHKELTKNNKDRLVNSYKNVVRWSVDEFFKILIKDNKLQDSLIIYSSDHGQNLLDDDDPVTHCRRNNVLQQEGMVPLFVITDRPELNFNMASHFQIFPTIIYILGYDEKTIEQQYGKGLFEKQDAKIGFAYGPIFGKFGKKVSWHFQ